MSAYTSGLRDIATAYIGHRECGAVNHSAFSAAMNTYQQRHPDVSRNEAALLISQLIDELANPSRRNIRAAIKHRFYYVARQMVSNDVSRHRKKVET